MYKIKTEYVLCCINIFIFMLLLGCSQTASLPQKLIGKWETSSPKYADRYIEFGEYYVTFGVGEDGNESYYVRKLNVKNDVNGTAYSLVYEDAAGEKWPLEILYTSAEENFITLKNSDVVWKKVQTGDE